MSVVGIDTLEGGLLAWRWTCDVRTEAAEDGKNAICDFNAEDYRVTVTNIVGEPKDTSLTAMLGKSLEKGGAKIYQLMFLETVPEVGEKDVVVLFLGGRAVVLDILGSGKVEVYFVGLGATELRMRLRLRRPEVS